LTNALPKEPVPPVINIDWSQISTDCCMEKASETRRPFKKMY
jgi:hypothetical protein